MKILSIAVIAALLPFAAVAESPPLRAGVSLVPPPGNTGAVSPSEQASTLRDPKKAGGKTLRCWQNGRLLYEDSGFKAEAERQGSAVVVPRHDGESVTVFDQRDAVCILSGK